MNNLFKVILALAAGFLLYYALHLLVALVSLAFCALLVAVLIRTYKTHFTDTRNP